MPIFTMINKEKYEQMLLTAPDFVSSRTMDGNEIYLEKRYEGAVLDQFEYSGRDDSDFYAVILDGDEIKHVQYATTRFWTYANGCVVDASSEVRARAAEINRQKLLGYYAREDEKQSKKVQVGREVKIVAGVKVPVGPVGVVVSKDPNPYGFKNKNDRIEILTGDGEVYRSYVNNVEVVNPERYQKGGFESLADWNKNRFWEFRSEIGY